MHTAALELEPRQFLAGWRPDVQRLFVPALSDARPGDPVAVRLAIAGGPVHAVVFGRVTSVRKVGRPSLPPGVEIAPDPASTPALSLLLAAARGERVRFLEREPRYLVTRRVVLVRGPGRIPLATANVSRRGCAVLWPGEPPQRGAALRLKLGTGLVAPTTRAIVCWTAQRDSETTVGLRLALYGLPERIWRRVARSAERSGAKSI